MNPHERPTDKLVICRLCKRQFLRSGLFSHAHSRHKEEFFAYLHGKDYGFSVWEIMDAREVMRR